MKLNEMMNCGFLSNGYIEYTCEKCGEIKRVPFSCKSRFAQLVVKFI